MIKLKQTEEKLGFPVPGYLFDFIAGLKQPEVQFQEETWLFWTVTDKPEDPDDNFICTHSADFENEWGVKGLVFATNGIGDYLVLLRDDADREFLPQVFVMMHEAAEIKVFAENWDDLIKHGPDSYNWTDRFHLKLDENNEVVSWSEDLNSEENDFFGDDYALRSKLDDLIDDERTDQASEIIMGLEQLAECEDGSHKVWALNKLSDIYFKGFGPIPTDMPKALDYNQSAMDHNSHLAYSNRATCYFFGFGLNKDLNKALEYATKANELSKSNQFADLFATTENGGMYDKQVEMIKNEVAKQKNLPKNKKQ